MKPRIVFLDAATVDYGDVPLDGFSRFGAFKAWKGTPPSAVEARCRAADIVLTNKCRFDAELLGRLPRLKYIGLAATGTNNVDLEAARQRGVAVANVAGYSTDTVVQCTFAFLLAHAVNLIKQDASARARWSRSRFFAMSEHPVHEIAGKTLGIVGAGRIGSRVAAVARAFGMKVVFARIPGRRYPARERAKRVPLAGLLRRSDYVSLHAALSPQTERIIDARALSLMKRSAVLINMARGALVDEAALAAALRSGRIAAAATDVLSVEPPPPTNPLLRAPNMLITPHVAWASVEARRRLVREMQLNLAAFLSRRSRNRAA